MMEDGERDEAGGPAPGGREMSEAEIDRTLAETFPASDPPPWTLGTDHRDEAPSRPAPRPAPDEHEE
jgi:hypothetical protein